VLHLFCDGDHFAKVLLSDRAQVYVGIIPDQKARQSSTGNTRIAGGLRLLVVCRDRTAIISKTMPTPPQSYGYLFP
jgi:hypothetical protein